MAGNVFVDDIAVTSSFVPTIAGKLFFLKELAGPMVAECN